jgi:pimeloyl-ACP methyl ester carboxylesterase
MRLQTASDCWIEFDDVGSGLPVVLLHAFPLDRALWKPQLEELPDQCRVIAPDFRGFGGTSASLANLSVDRFADDVAQLLDALKVPGPVVLAGLSMGGYAALAFARRHPDRLRGLVLADTRAEADTPESRESRDKMIAFAKTHSPLEVVDQMLPRLLGGETQTHHPEIGAAIRTIAARQSNAGIVAALHVLRDRPDATGGLAAIRVPTLVVVGAEDVLTPPAVAEAMAAAIPGSRFAKIAAAGHLSNFEQPEMFNAVLGAFLSSLGGVG